MFELEQPLSHDLSADAGRQRIDTGMGRWLTFAVTKPDIR